MPSEFSLQRSFLSRLRAEARTANSIMTPFILKGATKIPDEEAPTEGQLYDSELQLWIDTRTGVPLVSAAVATKACEPDKECAEEYLVNSDSARTPPMTASQFGETLLTRTSEGVDQSEATAFSASPFGETGHTATVESVDNPETVTAQQIDVDVAYSHF